MDVCEPLIVGRGGETIKGLQAQTGARLQIDQATTPCKIIITGNPYCVEAGAYTRSS